VTLAIIAHAIAFSWFTWLAFGVLGAVAAKRDAAARARAEFARQRMPQWRLDPVLWAQERLGVSVTDDQAAVMRDVAEHALTSWRAGQKVGKSDAIAILALWWVDTRPTAIVILTSGNQAQVKHVLWRALRRLHKAAKIPIGGVLHTDPGTGLVFSDGRLVIGITAADATRMSGYSGAELLYLCDESSGLSDDILEACVGNLAGGGHLLLCGNPTTPIGLFARTHHEVLDGWRRHHTSARVVAARNAIKTVVGLATLAWVKMMEATFGADSAAVAVRVDGEYPAEGADSVIGVALVEAAKMRWSADSQGFGSLEVGCDAARYGDDSSGIQGRRGNHAFAPKQIRKQDGPAVAAATLAYVEELRRPGEQVIVRVDAIGIGASVYDSLVRTAPTGVTIAAVQSSETSRHPDRFKNVRSELWWCVRRWLERGGELPPDHDKRDAELLAARYSTDHAHRVVVASKDEMKKRLKRSPDLADALALACFGESPTEDVSAHSQRFRPLPPIRVTRIYDAPVSFPNSFPRVKRKWEM
jgi:phage terminase large subunit